MIRIISNGSKWAGESPDSLDKLCQVLQTETLHFMFEECGNFVLYPALEYDSTVRFFGNFLTVSHGFSIDTDEPEVIERLTKLIRANQQTEAYKRSRGSREPITAVYEDGSRYEWAFVEWFDSNIESEECMRLVPELLAGESVMLGGGAQPLCRMWVGDQEPANA